MPGSFINRTQVKPCFCGHALLSHNVPAVQAPPAAASLGSRPGGALGAATYYVRLAFNNPNGTTLAGPETSLAVGANNLLTVVSSLAVPAINSIGIYVSTAAGTETLQYTYPLIIGNQPNNGLLTWTLPTTGLIAGTALPVSNTATTLGCLECGDGHGFAAQPEVFVTPQVLNAGR